MWRFSNTEFPKTNFQLKFKSQFGKYQSCPICVPLSKLSERVFVFCADYYDTLWMLFCPLGISSLSRSLFNLPFFFPSLRSLRSLRLIPFPNLAAKRSSRNLITLVVASLHWGPVIWIWDLFKNCGLGFPSVSTCRADLISLSREGAMSRRSTQK